MDHLFTDETFDKRDFKVVPLLRGEYENCVFTNCDLSGCDLSEVQFTSCEFTDCNLSMAKLSKTAFRDVRFKGCKMLGLRFDDCSKFALSFTFDGCTLDHSSFYQAKIKQTVFRNSQLQEVDLTECDLAGAVFDNCNLVGATFDNTILEKADMRGALNYAIDPEKNKIKKAKFALSQVAGLLYKYNIEIDKTL
jgi:fluoroquinolone resistance protein